MKYKNLSALLLLFTSVSAIAAINIDRTRVIFSGKDKSVTLVINNQSKNLPYLAQSWIEDSQGNKVSEPFTVLPPMQRVEPGAKNQIKLISTDTVKSLPQDRESIYYLNVREIPPTPDKENVVQIAIQSRLKVFYRPVTILNDSDKIWAKELKINRQGQSLILDNPTPYFITLGYLSDNEKGNFPKFESAMIPPFAKENVTIPAKAFTKLYLGYMDDYGGLRMLAYDCSALVCNLISKDK